MAYRKAEKSTADIMSREQLAGLEKVNFRPVSSSLHVNVEWFRILSRSELANLNRHSHSGIEVHFLLKGCHTFLFPARKITLQAHQGIIIPPNLSHQLVNENGDSPYFLRCVLNCSIRPADDNPEGQFVANALLNAEPWRFDISDATEEILNECIGEMTDTHIGYVTMIENDIIRLLFRLARERTGWPSADYEISVKQSHSSQTANEVRKYIEENSSYGLHVDDVARHVHMSTKQAQRIYKQEYGITIYQQINRCVLQKSKELLQETSLSIGEIAQQLGFSTLQSFCRFFRSIEGQSPKDYRIGVLAQD